MKKIPNNIKAALIDLDGTVFDSMGIWEKIDKMWLSKHNLPYSVEYSESLKSKSFAESADFTIRYFGLTDLSTEKIMSEWNDMAKYEYSNTIKPKPLAAEYLHILKQSGIKLAVVTSLSEELYKPLLKNNNLYELFDTFLSTVDTGIGKEKPHIYQSAADALQTNPKDCIVFEDILQGIRCAKSINMRTVAVYDRFSQDAADIMKKEADAYIMSFYEAPLPDMRNNALLTSEYFKGLEKAKTRLR